MAAKLLEVQGGAVRHWMATVVPDPAHKAKLTGPGSFHEVLKDGVILCHFLNALYPGTITRNISTLASAFKQMENIAAFLEGCKKVRRDERDLYSFVTVDLFEAKNLPKVLDCLIEFQKLHAPEEYKKLRGEVREAPAAAPADIKQDSAPNPSASASQIKKDDAFGFKKSGSVRGAGDEQELHSQLKFSPALEAACRTWLSALIGRPFPASEPLIPHLKDGVALCRALNVLQPGSVAPELIYEGKLAFKQLENVHYYLKGVTLFGVASSDLFDPADLYEEKNVNMVLTHINALAKHAESRPGYSGPKISYTARAGANLLGQALLGNEIEVDEHMDEGLTDEERELLQWAEKALSAIPPPPEVGDGPSPSPPLISSAWKVPSFQSLRSGLRLLHLLRVLAGLPPTALQGHVRQPKTLIDFLRNINLFVRILQAITIERFTAALPQQMVNGDKAPLAAALRYLQDKFDLEAAFEKLLAEGLKDAGYFDEEEEEKLDKKEKELKEKSKSSPAEKPSKSEKKDKEKGKGSEKGGEKKESRVKVTTAERKEGEKPKKEEKKDDKTRAGEKESPEKGTPKTGKKVKEGEKSGKERSHHKKTSSSSGTLDVDKHLKQHTKSAAEASSPSPKKEKAEKKDDPKAEANAPSNTGSKNPVQRLKLAGIMRSVSRDHLATARANAAAKMRDNVSREVLSSERSYTASLEKLVQHFVTPVSAFLAPEDLLGICGNVLTIYNHHKKFLAALEPLVDNSVARLFAEQTAWVKDYGLYLQRHATFSTALRLLKRKWPQLEEKQNALEQQMNGLKLADVLIMPVQRLPRYVMLLQQLLKFSDGRPDANALAEASKLMEQRLVDLNAQIDPESLNRMEAAASVLDALPEATEKDVPTSLPRRLLREGQLTIVKHSSPAKKKLAGRKVQTWLCDDLCIFATAMDRKKDEDAKYSLLESLAIPSIAHAKFSEKKKHFELQLLGGDELLLEAKAEDECVQWVAAFNGALGPQHGIASGGGAAIPRGLSGLSAKLLDANKK